MAKSATPTAGADEAPGFGPDEAIDPWRQPFEYLRSRGWKFKGNPHTPFSLWFDPQRPREESEERRVVPVAGVKLDPTDPERKRLVPCVVREIERVFVTPGCAPVSREEAVQIQLERDFDEAEAARR